MSDNRSIKREIINLLLKEHLRLTPISLERAVTQRIPMTTKKAFRSALKELLTAGQLTYTQHFSTTHLEINYNRPFKVSDRIVLSPMESSLKSDENHLVIKLNDGSSFGAGDHPTTRMMLQAMDYVLHPKRAGTNPGIHQALDIGTGSGILAIAASVLGVEKVVGLDIDPMACHEANENVRLNGCEGEVNISFAPLDDFSDRKFELVLANLRPPTIRELIPSMLALSSRHAVWIISGCRVKEKKSLMHIFPQDLTNIIWEADQNNWSAFAVKKESCP